MKHYGFVISGSGVRFLSPAPYKTISYNYLSSRFFWMGQVLGQLRHGLQCYTLTLSVTIDAKTNELQPNGCSLTRRRESRCTCKLNHPRRTFRDLACLTMNECGQSKRRSSGRIYEGPPGEYCSTDSH